MSKIVIPNEVLYGGMRFAKASMYPRTGLPYGAAQHFYQQANFLSRKIERRTEIYREIVCFVHHTMSCLIF